MASLECIGRFGEYEVWESTHRTFTTWHITNGDGDIIEPGDDDLLRALMRIAVRQYGKPAVLGMLSPGQ